MVLLDAFFRFQRLHKRRRKTNGASVVNIRISLDRASLIPVDSSWQDLCATKQMRQPSPSGMHPSSNTGPRRYIVIKLIIFSFKYPLITDSRGMLAGRLAGNRLFHRLSFPRSSKAVTDTCALYTCFFADKDSSSRTWTSSVSSSSFRRKRNKTTMVGASAAGVSPEEIEALRKQVEDLKVRNLDSSDLKTYGDTINLKNLKSLTSQVYQPC